MSGTGKQYEHGIASVGPGTHLPDEPGGPPVCGMCGRVSASLAGVYLCVVCDTTKTHPAAR